MPATTLLAAALLLCAKASASAPPMSPEDCATQSLKWADKDGDGLLNEQEFVDLTLIAFDGTARVERMKLADWEQKRARLEKRLAASPDDAGLKARLADLGPQRVQVEERLARMAQERVKYAQAAAERFRVADADGSRAIDHPELVEACRVASESRAR